MNTSTHDTEILVDPDVPLVRITREFDAPRDVVFKAMIDPALISRWWGPRGHTTRVDKMEVRPGGAWRYISGTSAADETAFRGEYREIKAPERIVQTFEWEPMAGHISVDTATLTGDGAKLDAGSMWPIAFALTKLTAADEAKIRALVKKAVG